MISNIYDVLVHAQKEMTTSQFYVIMLTLRHCVSTTHLPSSFFFDFMLPLSLL